jgi:hypothetical protein
MKRFAVRGHYEGMDTRIRASSRAVVAAAIVAATLALNAQQSCPPPAQPVLHWVGQASGCTSENGLPCGTGELIVFSVTPNGGGSYPGCVTYLWNFGDGITSTAAAPFHAYAAAGAFSVSVRVRSGNDDAFGGKQMFVSATVVPAIEHFSAGATIVQRGQTVFLTWVTRNAISVRIDPIDLVLDATITSHRLVPTVTTTYTLTAFGAAAITRPSPPVTVIVVEPRRRAVRH